MVPLPFPSQRLQAGIPKQNPRCFISYNVLPALDDLCKYRDGLSLTGRRIWLSISSKALVLSSEVGANGSHGADVISGGECSMVIDALSQSIKRARVLPR